jgi:glucokinase
MLSIGIDIGGTKIALGLADQSGTILAKTVVPTPKAGRREILSIMKEKVYSLMEEADSKDWPKIIGIGIGTAGQIDFKNGCVLSGTTNIQGWNNVPLREEIENAFLLPVWVDNDVNVVLLAEKYLGAAVDENDVVCLALGTGVGGAVISGGEILRGSWGSAAELGHISIDLNGPLCNCGFRGCLETYASGPSIARMMKERLGTHGGEQITSQYVFSLFQQGDRTAVSVIDTMIHSLSFAIVNFIHTFNPSVVLLGGGVMSNGEWILEAVKEKIKTLGLRSMVDPVKVVSAKLGPDAGLIGAAYQSFVYQNQINHFQMEGIK